MSKRALHDMAWAGFGKRRFGLCFDKDKSFPRFVREGSLRAARIPFTRYYLSTYRRSW